MKGNEYKIYEEYAEMMIISNVYGVIKVMIDKEDVFKCSKITWHYGKNKDSVYIQGRNYGKMIKLHRYIMNISDSKIVVDHINRNTLDNRKTNLRLCNAQQNNFNKSKRINNTSGIIGVYRNKKTSKWVAKIKFDGRTIHLGYFDDIEEAIINRRIAEELLFGEYSPNDKLVNIDEVMYIKATENVSKRIKDKVA